MSIRLTKFKGGTHIPGSPGHIAQKVARDKFQANRKGHDWTEYRQFVSSLEAKGNTKCCRCQKPAIVVRYHVTTNNREALCQACHNSHLEKRKQELEFLDDGRRDDDGYDID